MIEALRRAVEMLREELRTRHGATHVEVALHVDAEARRVDVRGEVLVHRIAGMLAARLRAVLPADWTVDVSGVRAWAGGRWRALQERVSLHATRESDATCTVLRPEDGPVQQLAVASSDRVDAWLVRGMDGTVGWLRGALGDEVDAPSLRTPIDAPPADALAIAAQYLDVPYALGGTDERAIDCSGLVQRVLRRSHGIVVPRHSTDQRAIDPRPGPPPSGAGHLAFVWTAGEAMCHVGLVGPASVIHASRTRARVVEDPRDQFFAAATRVEHVPFAAIVDFATRVAGHASLVAAGFVLGANDGASQ